MDSHFLVAKGHCVIVWDRMFGTFQEEKDDEEIRFRLDLDKLITRTF